MPPISQSDTTETLRQVPTPMNTSAPFPLLAVLCILTNPLLAGREEFATPRNGANLGVWRITDEPAIRHWANYHNTQCWSPDGRYLCLTRWAPDLGRFGDHSIEVHLYDAHRDEIRLLERGFNPRWARHSNRLFYVRLIPRGRDQPEPVVEVRQLDLASGETTTLADGAIEWLGETTHDDAWLLGARRFRGRTPEFVTVRIGLGRERVVEELPMVVGSQLLPNPRHPVFFTRQDHKSEPFAATRWFYDLDGANKRIAVPTLQQCHMSWLGDGGFLLLGNGLVRGRRWDQPFPSNVDVLAGIAMGDISPCGRGGRYVCGDKNVADLRSGSGWRYLEPLSMISYPEASGDQSGNYDADPKGSPDGTKIAFVTNYDLKDGPLAFVADGQSQDATSLKVDSTEGFPERGHLTVQAEVIGYEGKTATSFEGIVRAVHATRRASLGAGQAVTSFEARLMSGAQWASVPGATSGMVKAMPEGSPLLRQRQTDVHVAVVRKPDRPFLRSMSNEVQVIPGENHFELRGYLLLRDGKRINPDPLPRGEVILKEAGAYQAVAVEWSGLESEPSPPLKVASPPTLRLLAETPEDFSWTAERWLSGGGEVAAEQARSAPEAVREVVHRLDGVIRREWHRSGVLTEAHDLDAAGQATRRVSYEDGRLARREYFDPAGERLSLERFDAAGFVTETVRFRPGGEETDHWWFERGLPVRQARGNEECFKDGERWISKRTGKAAPR